MYNNPYVNYQQSINDRIDGQIAQLQQMKEQMKTNQQPAINQTFQLAPTHQGGMRYASSIEDVNREMVYADTPFFSKDMSVVWIKNNKNEIKTYELNEIIAKDDKDIKIDFLIAQIEELKKGIKSNESNVNFNESITNTNESEESSNVSNVPKSTKKSK
jgi:hypothetical protein